MNLVRVVLNGWLIAVACDGGARVLAGLFFAATGSQALQLLITPFELVAVLGAAVVWLLIGIAPKLPIRALLPPLVAIWWIALGALPVSVLLFGSPGFQLAIGSVLLASVAAAEGLARTAGHGRWGLRWEPLGEGLGSTWSRGIGWLGGTAVAVPIASAAYLAIGIAWTVSWGTGGFLTVTGEGLAATHKVYVQGDDTVDLIAMIHIGEQSGYDQLFDGIPRQGSLVLAEGVADAQDLLQAPGDAYAKAAERIGLTAQRPIDEMADLAVRNADVDVSAFDPETIALLNIALSLYAGGEDSRRALEQYTAFAQRHRTDAAQVLDRVFDDVLHARNAHLLSEIDAARDDADRLVVPWGALHLAGVEEGLIARGWTLKETDRIVLIRWSTLLGR